MSDQGEDSRVPTAECSEVELSEHLHEPDDEFVRSGEQILRSFQDSGGTSILTVVKKKKRKKRRKSNKSNTLVSESDVSLSTTIDSGLTTPSSLSLNSTLVMSPIPKSASPATKLIQRSSVRNEGAILNFSTDSRDQASGEDDNGPGIIDCIHEASAMSALNEEPNEELETLDTKTDDCAPDAEINSSKAKAVESLLNEAQEQLQKERMKSCRLEAEQAKLNEELNRLRKLSKSTSVTDNIERQDGTKSEEEYKLLIESLRNTVLEQSNAEEKLKEQYIRVMKGHELELHVLRQSMQVEIDSLKGEVARWKEQWEFHQANKTTSFEVSRTDDDVDELALRTEWNVERERLIREKERMEARAHRSEVLNTELKAEMEQLQHNKSAAMSSSNFESVPTDLYAAQLELQKSRRRQTELEEEVQRCCDHYSQLKEEYDQREQEMEQEYYVRYEAKMNQISRMRMTCRSLELQLRDSEDENQRLRQQLAAAGIASPAVRTARHEVSVPVEHASSFAAEESQAVEEAAHTAVPINDISGDAEEDDHQVRYLSRQLEASKLELRKLRTQLGPQPAASNASSYCVVQ